MNADALERVAKLIRAIDDAADNAGLTLSGVVVVGDKEGEGSHGSIRFNDGSESTWEER
jgi:hypothetical protein